MRKKVVVLGGGGGGSNIAAALRDDFDVTAIITTFDDGGSTGRLKQAYKTPAVGDLRRVFAALSTNSYADLLNERFAKGDVAGHALGNLLLTAMFNKYGVEPAMNHAHRLFAVKGKVLGVSYDLSALHAEMMDRSIVHGEHNIDEPPKEREHIRVNRVWLDPDAYAAKGVIEAIENAGLIVFGPGDIYTSIVPCLLVKGVAEAVLKSKAKKIYFCNLFMKQGQTNGFSASDHVRVLEQYLTKHGVIDTVILVKASYDKSLLEQGGVPVKQDVENLRASGYAVVKADLLAATSPDYSPADVIKRAKVAYDPDKVAKLVGGIINSKS